METYIVLVNFTQQGIQNIKESPARLDTAKAAMAAAGVEFKGWYLTLEQYDAVLIAEAPNAEVGTSLALAIGSGGNIRTQTMRAFTEEEAKKLIAALP